MSRVGAPVYWYGGKANWVDRIVPWLPGPPTFTTYVEVFGGSAAVLFAKPPHPLEVYNDVDEGLVTFYTVLRDPLLFADLIHRLDLTPYARAEFARCLRTWRHMTDPVEKARRWFVAVRQSFSGHIEQGSWSFGVQPQGDHSLHTHRWRSALAELPRFHERFKRVQVEGDDWRAILDRYDSPQTVFYCDPPYVPDTRTVPKVYTHELTLADHAELVDRLLRIHGGVVLSGYDHPVYAPLTAAGWRVERYQTVAFAAGSTRATHARGTGAKQAARYCRTECLWINPALQARRPQMTWEWSHE